MESAMGTKLSPIRWPLMEKPNSPPPSLKQVRRKSSFIRRIDSSEECPSPHESIYEAYYISTSDESINKIEYIPLVETCEPNENHRTNQDAEFRYGHGTVLDTIREQKSTGTMRSLGRPKSADDVWNVPFLCHRNNFQMAKSPRRQYAFSLDDMHSINKSYHELCHEIYASPKMPLKDPVVRLNTPPGMPSWVATETARVPLMRRMTYHAPGKSNRIQRLLGFPPLGKTVPAPVSHPEAPRSVSAPVTVERVRQAPRFRPPRSAYGSISRHPFNDAPVATVSVPTSKSISKPVPSYGLSNKKVRFTPSATARDSAEINIRNAMESSIAAAMHPLAPTNPVLPIAQIDVARRKLRICLHRKKKLPPVARGENVMNVENCVSIETVGHDSVSRNSSVSSTAPLMSGALSHRSFPDGSIPISSIIEGAVLNQSGNGRQNRESNKQLGPCWKCRCEKCIERVGHFWDESARFLCLLVCGYDCDDESTVYDAYHGSESGISGHFAEGRRDLFEQTPVSIV